MARICRPRHYAAAALALAGGIGIAVWATQRYGELSILPEPAWGLSFAALVWLAVAQKHVRRCLSHPWLVRVGIFSYSVYLVHQPFVKLGLRIAQHLHLPIVPVSLLLIAPAALAIGYLFHLLFERPFLHAPEKRKTAPENATITLAAPSS